jgi:hypothetical protein
VQLAAANTAKSEIITELRASRGCPMVAGTATASGADADSDDDGVTMTITITPPATTLLDLGVVSPPQTFCHKTGCTARRSAFGVAISQPGQGLCRCSA